MRKLAPAALVIFARQPQPGRVKTRLVPPLTPEQALGLHIACVESTAHLVAALSPSVDKWLYLTPRRHAAARRTLQTRRLPRTLRLRTQRGHDLGARLQGAFRELLAEGYRQVLIIGSDSPTLTPQRLRDAFAALRRADAVIGPARDGGYYLIGLRAAPGGAPEMFRGIDWGTRRTFRQTRARLREAGCRVRVLPVGYDVDTAADLRRLGRALRRSCQPHLAPLRAWFVRQQREGAR
ncbi:MAG: TIGR04282 family arsenosugar biosynthesis glycosyltransferase [Terriglobia bacterium]